MQNIDIKDFATVSSVEGFDHVLLSLFGGSAAKVSVSLLQNVVARGITPSIDENGVWHIGEKNTGVAAEGKTPEFRKGVSSIEWKYTKESDSAWKTLVPFSDLSLNFDDLTEEQRELISLKYEDLTPEQKAELRLKYEDLTPEQKAELQQPATEAAERISEEEKTWKAAEEARVKAEQERVTAEEERKYFESVRKADADAWAIAEFQRARQEEVRASDEAKRESAEKARADAEALRQTSETKRDEKEQVRQQWYENASAEWGNQTLAIELAENGDVNVITGSPNSGFVAGRIEESGDVVLEFNYW